MKPRIVSFVAAIRLYLRQRLQRIKDEVDDLLIGSHLSQHRHLFDAVHVLYRSAAHPFRLADKQTSAYPDPVHVDDVSDADVLVSPVDLGVRDRIVTEPRRKNQRERFIGRRLRFLDVEPFAKISKESDV